MKFIFNFICLTNMAKLSPRMPRNADSRMNSPVASYSQRAISWAFVFQSVQVIAKQSVININSSSSSSGSEVEDSLSEEKKRYSVYCYKEGSVFNEFIFWGVCYGTMQIFVE